MQQIALEFLPTLLATFPTTHFPRLMSYEKLMERRPLAKTHDVYADSLTGPRAIALLPNAAFKELFQDVYVCVKPGVTAQYLLEFFHLLPVDWSKRFLLGELQESMLPIIEEFAKLKDCSLLDQETHVRTYVAPADRKLLSLDCLGSDYVLSNLVPEDVDHVNNTWKYKNATTKSRLQYCIENFPSTCVREKVSGTVVCHCITAHYGTLAVLYTDEKHRRKGLAHVVIQEHARKLDEFLGFAHAHVAESNEASIQLFEGLGWKDIRHNICWMDWSPKKIMGASRSNAC